ncbi:MAG: galactose-1-epimerase [Rhodobacteraceae bacterium]|nr:galactose-1-epimerase [Paracoccaceae bacterium]MBR26148.1 galactose-1-epimerase [Paracoccaceae bacterium]
MPVTLRPFAEYRGAPVMEAELRSDVAAIRVLSWGCVIRDWRAEAPEGPRPVTLGFEDFAPYPTHSPAFGALCGRVANRIANARFALDGREIAVTPNTPPHHLHGGLDGFGRRDWTMETDGTALRLTRVSPHGEEGYPGEVALDVVMRLEGGRLRVDMSARPDRPTPINLAQHSYWNLGGAGAAGGDVLDHRLRLAASHCTPTRPDLIPTGEIASVAGGPLDFRAARPLRDADGAPLPLDLNFALDARDPAEPAAEVLSPSGDLRLRLWTDQPGVQVYNAPRLAIPVPGLEGRRYGAYAGLCLEAQNFPDAVNQPGFPDPIFTPDRPYSQRLEIEIART